MKRHYPSLSGLWSLSSVPPDIHLTILRFSLGVVKGNLNSALAQMPFEPCSKGPMLRRLKASRARKTLAGAKMFIEFRFRAKVLRSWASFLLPNRIGIRRKIEQVDRFDGNPGSYLEEELSRQHRWISYALSQEHPPLQELTLGGCPPDKQNKT
jgi:hypothetical protein